MDHRPALSPETLAAQALGDVDAGSGGLAPVINPATTYEQLPDGAYHQGRVYTRADNPTYEVAERLLAALEGAGCAFVLFAVGRAAPGVRDLAGLASRDRPLIVVLGAGQDRGELVGAALLVGYDNLNGELDGGMMAGRRTVHRKHPARGPGHRPRSLREPGAGCPPAWRVGIGAPARRPHRPAGSHVRGTGSGP